MNELFDGQGVYTVGEVASALRVSPVTVGRAIHKGNLKAFRIEGQWRILGREVMRYLYQERDRTLAGSPARPPD